MSDPISPVLAYTDGLGHPRPVTKFIHIHPPHALALTSDLQPVDVLQFIAG